MTQQLVLKKIDKNSCDVFYGVDYWHNTEWCRFRKNKKNIWELVGGPIHYKWFDKIANETKIVRSFKPKGSVLRAIYELIKESYV